MQIENYEIIPIGRGKDLSNQIFGDYQVLYRTNPPITTKSKQAYWLCQCTKCYKYVVKSASILTHGINQCNCINDLTNKKFGRWTVLYKTDKRTKNRHILWHCRCDCGNQCDIDMGNLRSYKTQSCGCTNSRQEENIIKLLVANNIKFNYQFRFNNMKDKVFDFYINNSYIIEYDGQQHFHYIGTGWDTKEHFERTRQNDLLKNQYCFENNIPLIRIPFNEEYNFEDLKLETTRYLLTKENEKEYYEKIK